MTGIDLVINQPDHSAYYDVMQQTMADPDQWPDVLIMSSTYYSDFAANGALWDMTEAWENSNTKNSGRFTGDSVIEGLKINGRLYGFSPARGNGCVTYVKKAWMDKAGITKAPTNWEEYAAMLDAFSKLGVDGKTTYGTSAAGFIGNEAPYTNYLPEFYQDAYPSFILKDGVYVDGFTQPEMEAALARLKEGYDKGWIDPTTLTNSTKDCRNKFYDEQFGVFTYWAGTWATNLKTNLEANGHDSELIALPPIAEVGAYFDRIPPVWCITSTCENPEGVFAYFIDTMLDGGDMQMLWTYGAEGTHWSRAAETVLDKTYEEGTFHFLENLEKAGTLYTKNHIDPMLSLASFAEGYPAINVLTNDKFVYWKPEGTESSGYVDLLFDEQVSFNVVMMQEFIRHGQKVSHYSISILEGEDWVEVAKGTTIGVKKMNVLEKPVSTKGVRLTIIDTWNDYVPEISRIGLFTSEYY